MSDEKPELFGKLFFRYEGEFVNAYVEEVIDAAPVHLASVRAHFYRIPRIQAGFVEFAKFMVQMSFLDMGLTPPNFGDVNQTADPVSGIKQ